ncbi:MAG TPA: response regulator [Pirellulales bacterium]|jgi:CheY-like chemotaxis protein
MNERILVAEDSATQAIQIKHILAAAEFEVETAANGEEALRAIERQPPDLVLTDLDMPKLNGLQLVEAVHRRFPRVPVVLMTAYGNDEVAARALEAGAASYVPKRNLDRDLLGTIRDMLAVVVTDRELARLTEFLTGEDARYEIDNDLASIPPIVAHVQSELAELGLADESERIRLGIALSTAMRNAICCGNLEVTTGCGPEHFEIGGGRSIDQLVVERSGQAPYRDRSAWLETRLTRDKIEFLVGHQGPRFTDERLFGNRNGERLDSDADGWLLIKSFMDEVTLSADGKQLTMVKHSAR